MYISADVAGEAAPRWEEISPVECQPAKVAVVQRIGSTRGAGWLVRVRKLRGQLKVPRFGSRESVRGNGREKLRLLI